MKDGQHFVYVLESANGKYYTGYTTDVERRMKQHAQGKAAHFTSAFGFSKLLYVETHPDKSTALKREAEIKKLPRAEKRILMKGCQGSPRHKAQKNS